MFPQMDKSMHVGTVCSNALNSALIDILILTVDQIIMCKVRWVACSDKPTVTCHPTVQFLSGMA